MIVIDIVFLRPHEWQYRQISFTSFKCSCILSLGKVWESEVNPWDFWPLFARCCTRLAWRKSVKLSEHVNLRLFWTFFHPDDRFGVSCDRSVHFCCKTSIVFTLLARKPTFFNLNPRRSTFTQSFERAVVKQTQTDTCAIEHVLKFYIFVFCKCVTEYQSQVAHWGCFAWTLISPWDIIELCYAYHHHQRHHHRQLS